MTLLEYKCPNCGGTIRFDPETQEMGCPHCRSVINIEALKVMDEEIGQNREPESVVWVYEGDEWREGELQGMAVYSCNTCGGEIVGDETLGATFCPFCRTPVVMTRTFAGMSRPDMVIPFKLGRDAALNALRQHYLGKKLLPKTFKDENNMEEIKGLYVPFWLFDADVDARIEFNAKKSRTWSDDKYDYTETSVFRATRAGSVGFRQVPVDGSKIMDDTLMESIEPYSMEEAVDFRSTYLAGYFANKYDIDAAQSNERANERMINSTVSVFAATVNSYNMVTPLSKNISLESGGVHYALFPVWLLSTRWKGKSFIFAMNGQTGRFIGDLPLDRIAYSRLLLKMLGITAGVLIILFEIAFLFI